MKATLNDLLNAKGVSEPLREAVKALIDRLEAAEGELETERMRLVACSIAALGYFEGCIKEYTSASLDDVLNLRKRLEAAEKDVALKEQVIDALGSELNAVANERDALRTVLTDLLNDLEDRAKWNLEEGQRVVACGNGVYMRAKAALEEAK